VLFLHARVTLKTAATPEDETTRAEHTFAGLFWYLSVLASQCSGIAGQTALSLLKKTDEA